MLPASDDSNACDIKKLTGEITKVILWISKFQCHVLKVCKNLSCVLQKVSCECLLFPAKWEKRPASASAKKVSFGWHPSEPPLYFILANGNNLSPEAGSSFRWSPRGPLWISFGFIFWKFLPPTEKSFILTDGRTDVPFPKAEKTWFLEISQKLLNIFSWLFLVPTKECFSNIMDVFELEKSDVCPTKNRLTFRLFFPYCSKRSYFSEIL